jgi:hypothetical protein
MFNDPAANPCSSCSAWCFPLALVRRGCRPASRCLNSRRRTSCRHPLVQLLGADQAVSAAGVRTCCSPLQTFARTEPRPEGSDFFSDNRRIHRVPSVRRCHNQGLAVHVRAPDRGSFENQAHRRRPVADRIPQVAPSGPTFALRFRPPFQSGVDVAEAKQASTRMICAKPPPMGSARRSEPA